MFRLHSFRHVGSPDLLAYLTPARKFLAELSSKGVRSATVGERSLKQTTFVIHEPGEDVIENMLNLQLEFPDSELKASGCEALIHPH